MSVEKNYHLMFTDLKECAVTSIYNIAKVDHLWSVTRQDETAGFDLLRKLCSQLSECYNLPIPSLKKGSYECYWIPGEHIELPKVSLVSFLHEYRHHMQKYNMQHYPDKEVDARAWSISCFYRTLPEDFDKAWREHKIWFMSPHP